MCLRSFLNNLNALPITIAEIIVILHGLYLCWNNGFRKVELFSNCVEALELIILGCDVNQRFKDVIEEARLLVASRLSCTGQHVPKERN